MKVNRKRRFAPGTIGKRIDKAMEQLSFNDLEDAMLHACIAAGATSRREYRDVRRDNEAYKRFLSKNIQLIFLVATCGQVRVSTPSIRFRVKDDAVRTDARGLAPLESILYHMVRCSLIHNSVMPKDFALTSRDLKGWRISRPENGPLTMPWQLIVGLVLAVVGSPQNAYERAKGTWSVQGTGLNQLWGQKRKILELFVDPEGAAKLMG